MHRYVRRNVSPPGVPQPMQIVEAQFPAGARVTFETGSMRYFEPARRLYAKFRFKSCPPFGDYREDPNSVFMTREL